VEVLSIAKKKRNKQTQKKIPAAKGKREKTQTGADAGVHIRGGGPRWLLP
jgi:hypothetical protein